MTNEYREFRQWSQRMANHLATVPGSGGTRVTRFLLDLQAFTGELLEVGEWVQGLSSGGTLFAALRNLTRWRKFYPDPLRSVRLRMRAIRETYGEVPGYRGDRGA